MNRLETLWSVLGALTILTTGSTFAAHHEHGTEDSLAASGLTVGRAANGRPNLQRHPLWGTPGR